MTSSVLEGRDCDNISLSFIKEGDVITGLNRNKMMELNDNRVQKEEYLSKDIPFYFHQNLMGYIYCLQNNTVIVISVE